MRSIKFPDMFAPNSTRVWKTSEHRAATYQNTILLLNSARNELLGDPYFGTLLHKYVFEQNGYKLKDVIIDLIYTQIAIFIPQLKINRNDIEIVSTDKKAKMIVRFVATNQIDYQLDTYELNLFADNSEQTK